ncbi:MAG: cation-translocating P-type ATPase [Myxococcales bacterium]|nr:cation-translocating P-type ATPase [Myxococcales bacterium]
MRSRARDALAITAAIGKAARRGILARSGTALETLGRLRRGTLFFDKTGTLTHGRMEVVSFRGPDWVKPLVEAAERDSTHPVGRALRQAFADTDRRLEAESVEVVHGGGLLAVVGGRRVIVGSPKFVGERALRDHTMEEHSDLWSRDAITPVWIAVDGRVVAMVGLEDRIQSEAAECLRALEERGFEIAILSGDHPEVVRAVGRRLGVAEDRCHGGLSPEQKLEHVKSRSEGDVIMVGDGVNDAAALAAAKVGIAVHGGAETCFAAADIFLQKPGVAPVVELIDGARRTTATIRTNIWVSLFYNAAGASMAIAGLLNPLIAAVLMPLSSLAVVTHSFRFRFGSNSVANPR